MEKRLFTSSKALRLVLGPTKPLFGRLFQGLKRSGRKSDQFSAEVKLYSLPYAYGIQR